MNTLIAYSSRHGTTREYAESVARRLSGPVTLVDLRAQPDVDPAPFDRVVVGGCIYVGQVQKEVTEFCSRNLAALKQKRLGLFICCMFEAEAPKQLLGAYPRELLESAAVKAALLGRLDFPRLTFLERLATKMVAKIKESKSLYSEEAARSFAAALEGA